MTDLNMYPIDKAYLSPGTTKPRWMRSLTGSNRSHQGFTLLEILIAITMVAFIMATLLGTFTGVISSSRDAMKRAEIYQTGRALMDLISADIRGFFPLPLPEGGISFLGLSERDEKDAWTARADFVTTNSLPIGLEPNPFLSEVGYRVKRNVGDHLFSLWRRAQYPPEYPYDEGGREVPVCRVLESFLLEFVDINGKSLSLLQTAPTAVIVHFTLNLEGERENFVTMIRPMVGWGASSVSPEQVSKQ